jgi:hypothetical protein
VCAKHKQNASDYHQHHAIDARIESGLADEDVSHPIDTVRQGVDLCGITEHNRQASVSCLLYLPLCGALGSCPAVLLTPLACEADESYRSEEAYAHKVQEPA